jgi:hypothetical protein
MGAPGFCGEEEVPLLFLLKDHQGQALLIAQAATQAEADAFGRNHLPEFCGESVEIDAQSQNEAEEFWGVRSVRVVNVLLDVTRTATAVQESRPSTRRASSPVAVWTHIFVHGLELPEEVEADDLLTAEDRRDLALDHIARTCELIGQIEIRKWA